MNKTETQALWRALCACTCKAGTRAPHDCVYIDQVSTFDAILSYDDQHRDFTDCLSLYDPAMLALAIRAHKATGSRNLRFFPGTNRGRFAHLILRSSVATPRDPIIITTAIQGLREVRRGI